MFNPITVPFDAKMLFNVVYLKPGYTIDDVELVVGEMCNVVKETYKDDGGFISGQVFKSAGFISEEGSLGGADPEEHGKVAGVLTREHVVIITYWKSFEQHEDSHANELFKEKFSALLEMCEDTFEVGYEMLWQGEPE